MKPILASTSLLLLLIFQGTVSAKIAPGTCRVSKTAVKFVYQPFSSIATTSSSGSVSVKCKNYSGSPVIALNAGLYSGGSFANRQMEKGNNRLLYQLYTSANMTTVWGDGTGGTGVVVLPCQNNACATKVVSTIYGSMPPLQIAKAGTYKDTITVTVTY